MSEGKYLFLYPDDSVSVNINDDDFVIDDEGRCTLAPIDIKCPLATGLDASPASGDVLGECNNYFNSFVTDFDGCTLGNKFGDDVPDCGYQITAIQITEDTWEVSFPAFAAPARRLAIRN